MEDLNIMIEKLKNGEIMRIEIPKERFYEFRSIIVNREDFKYFRGIAQQGGHVIYEYMDSERS